MRNEVISLLNEVGNGVTVIDNDIFINSDDKYSINKCIESFNVCMLFSYLVTKPVITLNYKSCVNDDLCPIVIINDNSMVKSAIHILRNICKEKRYVL